MAVRKRRGNKKQQESQDQLNTNDNKNDNENDNDASSRNSNVNNVNKKTKKMKGKMRDSKQIAERTISILLKFITMLLIIVPIFAYYFKVLWRHEKNKSNVSIDTELNNSNENDFMNLTEWYLTSFICKQAKPSGGYCHKGVKAIPTRRTHVAVDYIPKNETILILPRKYIITDLDAMNDPFIQDEFFADNEDSDIVKHHLTDNPLDAGAYLAVHLLSRRRRQSSDNNNSDNDYMVPFFRMLPDEHQLSNHPIFWPKEDILSLLGNNTLVSQTVIAFRDMMLSEYHAFASKSDKFKLLFSLQNYMLMRVHVISRSFGTGPVDSTEATPDHLSFIESKTGTSLQKGCRAMAPILDMYDHHAKPNAQWHYDTKKGFVVKSNGIPQGHDVMVSYGRYTDTHLFAKFGFVNGDGSGWTEASIASNHRLPDIGLGTQFTYPNLNNDNDLVQYLQYDDGQPECIKPTQEDQITLKQQKFEHVKLLSQVSKQWILRMLPRDDTAQPASSSHQLPNNTKLPNFSRNSKLDIQYVLSTCRLIVINQTDYDTLYSTILSKHTTTKEKIDSHNPILLHLPKQSDDAEFFALSCLERLTTKALSYYPSTVDKDMYYLKSQATNTSFYKSRVWNAMHVRLGEMQTLEVLRNVAISGMRQMLSRIQNRDNDQNDQNKKTSLSRFKVRKKPCPLEWSTQILLNDKKNDDDQKEVKSDNS